jgi:hypothetical protein
MTSFINPTAQLTLLFTEDNFNRLEDSDTNTISLFRNGPSVGEIDVLINLLSMDQFMDMGGTLEIGQDILIPAELTDFDPTPISITIPAVPPTDVPSEVTVEIPLNSIVSDTINEAEEGLVLMLEIVNIMAEDEMNLDLSERNISILFITDDDSKKENTAAEAMVERAT